jgi:hypothetical protein
MISIEEIQKNASKGLKKFEENKISLFETLLFEFIKLEPKEAILTADSIIEITSEMSPLQYTSLVTSNDILFNNVTEDILEKLK